MTAPSAIVRVGVVGSHALVSRIMRTAEGQLDDGPVIKLVPLVYEREEQAAELVLAQAQAIDAALFAGPLSYDLATRGGELSVPGTYLSVSGSALLAALVRLARSGTSNLERLTVDTFDEAELAEALAEVDLVASEIRVRPYRDPSDATTFVDFHRDAGGRAAALTTIPTVEQALREEGRVVELLRPTVTSIRSGVREAALLGAGRVMDGSRAACIVVLVAEEVESTAPSAVAAASWASAKAQVRVELARICAESGMALSAVGERGFVLHATQRIVSGLSSDGQVESVTERLQAEIAIPAQIGIGFALTPFEAERAAFRDATRRASRPAVNVEPEPQPGGREQLDLRMNQLVEIVERRGDGSVLDTQEIAELLDVSARTARRLLNHMVESGAAWRLPADPTGERGRPRRLYRILPMREQRAQGGAVTP